MIEEITYSLLYNKIKDKSLVIGLEYIISDYLTIYQSNHLNQNVYETWGYTKHVESKVWKLKVKAISNCTLNAFVTILEHPNYIVKYDITPKTFQDGITNKGTITYLKDANGNSAFYDFKNIRFKRIINRNGVTYSGNFYTFSTRKSGILRDNSESNNVKNNTLKEGCFNNVFIGKTCNTTLEFNTCGNTFFKGCTNSHFYKESCNNTLFVTVIDFIGTLRNAYIECNNNIFISTVSKIN